MVSNEKGLRSTWVDCAHAKSAMGPHAPHMPESTALFGVAKVNTRLGTLRVSALHGIKMIYLIFRVYLQCQTFLCG